MMIARRGFLGTMLAAATGAVANFDPLKGLWVPGAPTLVEGVPAPEIVIPSASWTKAVTDETAELTDLALRFVKQMAHRLERHQAVTLRQMLLQQTGHAGLGLITLEGGPGDGRGHFSPRNGRLVVEAWAEGGYAGARLKPEADAIEWAANTMRRDCYHVDMFAPIGHELRTGVPFTDCLVGVATDPESGLSARALRFRTNDKVLHTEFEMAAGNWKRAHYGARARRRGHEPITQILLSQELMGLGAEDAPGTQYQRMNEFDGSATVQASAGDFDLDKIGVRMVKEWDIERG